MIQPNELRLGNLVLRAIGWNNEARPIIWSDDSYVVSQLNDSTVWIDSENGTMDEDFTNISGIPLTEEWLLKAGFKNEYAQVYSGWIGDDIWGRMDFKVNIFCIISSGREAEESYLNHIKYVHQLQNLFHAISGEELEFKI